MRAIVLPFALLGLLLAGCGLKGPLKLPEPASPVTIHPAPTTAPTGAPAAEASLDPDTQRPKSQRPESPASPKKRLTSSMSR